MAVGKSTFRRVSLLVVLLAGNVGCGGVGTVSGKVTYKGKPVTSGSVLMVGSDNQPHYGPLQQDGTYAIADVPQGEVRVAVNSPDPRVLYAPAPTIKLAKKEGQPPPAPPPQIDASKWFPLPVKAGDPQVSGVRVTVRGGPNSIDINLPND